MHHVISKNLQSDFVAMHRGMKSRQSQVAFARGSGAESSHDLDSSISQDSDFMHQQHGSFFVCPGWYVQWALYCIQHYDISVSAG